MVFNRKIEPRTTTPAAAEPVTSRGPAADPAPAFAAPSPSAAPLGGYAALPESVIGNDFTIEGNSITIRCKGSLRVNGSIDASLHARKLVVGDTAVINGTITAENIAVHGRVSGAINGERVVLGKNSQVEGDIVSRYLEVEPGASFEGRSRKARDQADITPQLDPVTGGPAAEAGTNQIASQMTVLTPPESRLLS